MNTDIDLLIIGAGLVGNSLALALKNHANIAMIEANAANVVLPPDMRTIALSFSTRDILKALNVWSTLASYTTGIEQVHVCEAGHFGVTRFLAQDYQTDVLGHTILAQALTDTLRKAVLDSAIPVFFESYPIQIQAFPQRYRVQIKTPEGIQHFTTRLLVGADGADSLTRRLLGIDVQHKNYQQTALTAQVTLARAHQQIAYERFTEQGVLAALPLKNKESVGVIWTAPTEITDQLQHLSDAEFCQAFQSTFGYRLGKLLQVTHRQRYSLKGSKALQQICPHALLLGNAAHALHPVAAQGFNLSLRDVAMLAQVVMDALLAKKNPGDFSVLKQYEESRQQEQLAIMGLTQNLVRLFSQKNKVAGLARNMGLVGLDFIPFVKDWIANQTMGLANHMPAWVL